MSLMIVFFISNLYYEFYFFSADAIAAGLDKPPKYTPIYLWTDKQCKEWLNDTLGSLNDVRHETLNCTSGTLCLTLVHVYQSRKQENQERCILTAEAFNNKSVNGSLNLFRTSLALECVRSGVKTTTDDY